MTSTTFPFGRCFQYHVLYLNLTRVFFFSEFLLYLQMKKLYLTNKKVVERNKTFHIYV